MYVIYIRAKTTTILERMEYKKENIMEFSFFISLDIS
jgi:hypothetical protein